MVCRLILKKYIRKKDKPGKVLHLKLSLPVAQSLTHTNQYWQVSSGRPQDRQKVIRYQHSLLFQLCECICLIKALDFLLRHDNQQLRPILYMHLSPLGLY